MVQTLALIAVMLLLLAGAIELWWSSVSRKRIRLQSAQLERSLQVSPAPSGTPRAPLPQAATTSNAPVGTGLPRIDMLLLRAGLPTGWRVPVLLSIGGVALALLGWWRVGQWPIVPLLILLYAAGAGLWLRMRIDRLRQKFVRQLPNFIDGIVRVATIGNSLPMAFQAAIPSVPQPLRGVLDRALQSVRTGLDLDRALQLAAQPYKLEELELLHVILGTGMRMGGRADQILQRMSDFMRDLSQARQELRAITSETRMSSWVLGLLPLIVAGGLTVANPAFFKPMFIQPLGHHILAAALVMELIGAFLLYRLARSL